MADEAGMWRWVGGSFLSDGARMQVWGFKEVGGIRRYVRELRFTGPNGEKVSGRFMYDYLGPIQNL